MATRGFDQEYETMDRSLASSVQKAITLNDAPVKEKHARVIIIASHKEMSTLPYWSLTRRMPLQEHAVMAWKFCHVSHKLMRDGYRSWIKDCQASVSSIHDLGRMWGHLKEGYPALVAVYCRLVLQKVSFHRKYPKIPGTLVMEDADFDGHTMDEYFEMSVDMLDYLDQILKLQLMIFNSLDQSRLNSMTSSGQCMLAPLLPCVLDSSQLYHYLVKILFKLHSTLPADTLQGHRERFTKQYSLLRQFFKNASNLQYFKNLIRVPVLPDSLPNFLKAYELNSHVRPEVVVAEEEEVKSESPVAGNQNDAEEEAARLRGLLREKDDMLGRLEGDLRGREKELERVRREDRAVLESMRCKVIEMEAEADIQRRISESTTQENELLKNVLKQKNDLEAQASLGKSDLEKAAKANEEKFSKMRDIYAKLREEHVAMLKKYSEVSKQASSHLKEKEALQELHQREIERQRVEWEQTQKGTEEDKEKDVEVLVERNKELEEEVEKIRALLLEMERKGGEKEEEVRVMKREIEEMERVKKEKESLEGRMVLLEEEKSGLERRIGEMVRMKEEDEKVKGGVDERCRLLEKRLDESEEGMKVKEKEVDELKGRLRVMGEERGKEKSELEERMKEGEGRLVECRRKLGEIEREMEEKEGRMKEEMKLSRKNIFGSFQSNCSKLVQDSLDHSTDEFFADVKCPAECSLETINATKEAFKQFCALWNHYQEHQTDLSPILHSMNEFTHSFTHTLTLSFATSHSSPPLPGEALSSLCNQLGEDVIKVLSCQSQDEFSKQCSVVEGGLGRLGQGVGDLLSKGGEDVDAIGDLIEEEMRTATTIVQQAAEQLAKLLQESRLQHSGVHLEVNEKIIDSCNNLMMCIRKLIEASKVLQKEIVSQGRGTYSVGEFYKKHHRWTDGLISAAQSVGLGAKELLNAADKVVSRKGKFEELMVCAQEIAASTAQLVVASRVKADRHSSNLQGLSSASKAVAEATGLVVGAAKHGAERIDELEVFDFSQLSLHHAKRNEMDSQVRVLELESLLVKERRKLGELRKKHYQLAAEVEEATDLEMNNAAAAAVSSS